MLWVGCLDVGLKNHYQFLHVELIRQEVIIFIELFLKRLFLIRLNLLLNSKLSYLFTYVTKVFIKICVGNRAYALYLINHFVKMIKSVLTFLLLTYLLTVSGQDNYRFSAYTINDGLPQSSIWDIIQDKNGFIWAGTSDGLCRFDGYKFNVYKNNPTDSTSISSGKDNHFYVDKEQKLWIVSAKGISLFNDAKNNFINILTYDPPSIQQSNHNYIYGEWNGYIWVGLNQYGLVKVNAKTYQYEQVKQVGSFVLNNYHFWLKGFIEKGVIYGNTEYGFFKYQITKNSFETILLKKNSLGAIHFDDDEVLNYNTDYLIYINKKNLNVHKVPIFLPKGSDLVLDAIIHKADTSQLILATPVGLQYVHKHTGKLIKTITDFDPDKKRTYSYVSCFFTDKSGNLWIGTNGDGIRKMVYPYKKFNYYPSSNSNSSIVKSIYADADKLFIGYFDNGIDVFSRTKGFQKNLHIPTSGKSSTNHVFTIVPFNDGSLLINNFGENAITIFQYLPALQVVKNITGYLAKQLPQFLAFDHSHLTFCKTSNGKILGGCNETLFSIEFTNTKNLVAAKLQIFPSEKISCIYEDEMGEIWVGTYSSLYHFKNNSWTKINLNKNLLVKTICNDGEGNIWAGTVEGIHVIDKNDKVTWIYNEQTGLLNHFIYGILKDNQNNMWFSTNKGLGLFKKNEKKFRFYTKDDGLQANEFNTGAYYMAANGELFFGGINGTNSFYPHEILDNPNVPPVQITSIKLFDEPYQTKLAYWDIESIELPYTDNSLSFEFALPEFTNPQKNKYAYMMEGIDKNWIDAGARRFTRYAGMQPGNYTFKVKACNEDGVWTENPTTISITIIPPFWQRTWFIIIAIILSVLLIVAIVFFIQKQQFKKKMQAMEVQYKLQLERERISRDLHDNVGTQLSLISKSIQGILRDESPISLDDQKQKLQYTGQSSIEVINALRETIWALNKESVSAQEFFDRLKSFAQKQANLTSKTQLKFHEQLNDASVYLGATEVLHLFRICQEAITNALKYANASTVSIHLHTYLHKYSVSIKDDGIGFDLNNIDSSAHYGIENMKHRAKEISCELSIETSLNNGTDIVITKK